jgi:hypothetical protein
VLTWFLPADLLGWIIVAGMLALLAAAVLLTHPWTRLALTTLAVLALSWQIHHNGRVTERAIWQAKAKAEAERQERVNREATLEAERDIAERKRELDRLEREIAEIQREAEAAQGAGDIILDRADIDRINRLRR